MECAVQSAYCTRSSLSWLTPLTITFRVISLSQRALSCGLLDVVVIWSLVGSSIFAITRCGGRDSAAASSTDTRTTRRARARTTIDTNKLWSMVDHRWATLLHVMIRHSKRCFCTNSTQLDADKCAAGCLVWLAFSLMSVRSENLKLFVINQISNSRCLFHCRYNDEREILAISERDGHLRCCNHDEITVVGGTWLIYLIAFWSKYNRITITAAS
jgi:hypothetical protein